MAAESKIKVGITQGDINGIGYEVILKTLSDQRIAEMCTPIIYGSPKVAAYHRKNISNLENFNLNIIRTAAEASAKRANIVNVMGEEVKIEPGKLTAAGGQGALTALKAAVKDLKEQKIDVLVTAPFNKQNVQSESYTFPGHTEFLASTFEAPEVLMLLVNEGLRVGVATGHIPLAKVSEALNKGLILRKLRLLNKSLKQDFTIHKPRIAVLGLNPHAGDGGLLGSEENDTIIPAVEEAIKNGILAFGPYPADGFFGSDSIKRFDAVLAMYHDQGLAPFKAVAFNTGVNYTAGLPIVRTSPAHGTAYDIAGKDKASPDSLRAAIYMACDIYKSRKGYAEAGKNPVPYAPSAAPARKFE
ncbi:MAG: 4-hydroxythreonine-4-phosphate dehydrogenase PdxA [Prevotellaceae bacterium]|jgi:4-hydroxythreonine-4-phosphate dehydrogenase|nr:4-hydroxythreonine-4-phosphate dehydrogenase PdxA [Prevotellaceae bacterium]